MTAENPGDIAARSSRIPGGSDGSIATITGGTHWNVKRWSAQSSRIEISPASFSGRHAGSGRSRSRRRAMHDVSTYTSASSCITGIRRWPPVSGTRSGFGAMIGCSTPRHGIRL